MKSLFSRLYKQSKINKILMLAVVVGTFSVIPLTQANAYVAPSGGSYNYWAKCGTSYSYGITTDRRAWTIAKVSNSACQVKVKARYTTSYGANTWDESVAGKTTGVVTMYKVKIRSSVSFEYRICQWGGANAGCGTYYKSMST